MKQVTCFPPYPCKVTPTTISLPSIATETNLVIGWKLLSLGRPNPTMKMTSCFLRDPHHIPYVSAQRLFSIFVSALRIWGSCGSSLVDHKKQCLPRMFVDMGRKQNRRISLRSTCWPSCGTHSQRHCWSLRQKCVRIRCCPEVPSTSCMAWTNTGSVRFWTGNSRRSQTYTKKLKYIL